MSRIRRKRRKAKRGGRRGVRVRIGAVDPTLTGVAGLACVDELLDRLGVIEALDAEIGAFKTRNRGVSAGQLLTGLAAVQWTGGEWLSASDELRADPGTVLLPDAPVVASSTARALMRRFGPAQLAGIEAGLARIYDRWLALLPAPARAAPRPGRRRSIWTRPISRSTARPSSASATPTPG